MRLTPRGETKMPILRDAHITDAPEFLEMPEHTRKLLEELMRQNAMVLEANCRAIKLLSAPPMVVNNFDDRAV